MLGTRPLGLIPLGTIRRQAIGPVLAVFTSAGVAALSGAFSAKGSMVVTSAGNGTASFVSGNGRGVLTSSGIGAMSAALKALSSTTFNAAGIGSTSLVFAAQSRTAMASNGTAAFTAVMTAKASSITSMQGSSTFGVTDVIGSRTDFAGISTFTGVSYAFYSDAEKAGPPQEIRVAYVPYENRHFVDASADVPPEPRTVYIAAENRTAVAPTEDRVYYAKSKAASQGPPNRRRIL